MSKFLFHSIVLISLTAAGALAVSGQVDPFNRDRAREEEAKIVKDMLAKQQSAREKKDHEELLKRADVALELSDDLEKAFEDSPSLTPSDEKKLAELEKVVKKIRDDLGGDDDLEDETELAKTRPRDLKEAFDSLRKSTMDLVDEVKKTTRYSVSAAAIQSSNAVLRVVRFLRFGN